MPDNMITRVAKAMAEHDNGAPTTWKMYAEDARGILKAMRKLSAQEQAMLGNALGGQLSAFPDTPAAVLARHCWHAMIDEALAEQAPMG